MLRVENISKKYGQFELNDITFQVDKGDYFMLLGPSGAGKSIILEVIAGLIKPDKGSVFIEDIDITKLAIGSRSVGLVFQDLAVFPHLSVYDNIAFPLKRKGVKGQDLKSRVNGLAEEFSISHLIKRNPQNLSGGELQRVALARTLALKPKVLLLDEPLSSIDVQLRAGLKSLLRGINREGQTVIHVTHDYDEAISLGSHVAVVNGGRIVQTGTPVDVFQNPASEFVANFSGIKNFFKGSISDCSEHDLRCFIANGVKIWLYTDEKSSYGYVSFPENSVSISSDNPNSSAINTFQGVIVDIFQQKHGFEVWVDIGIRVAALITWESLERLNLRTGNKVWISVKANAVRYINQA
ncbi:MAG: ABC transporter ATP-binding protein [Bacteroidales bacterium]|nr:MAG: ABC transporter ATP-binding protein [Bacteroidales bacterium]